MNMDVMSIAATSISLSQMQTAQAVSVAVTRKAMDQMTQQAAAIVEDIQQAVPPTVPGSHMDILA
jgi:hypothetical protein